MDELVSSSSYEIGSLSAGLTAESALSVGVLVGGTIVEGVEGDSDATFLTLALVVVYGGGHGLALREECDQ